MIRPQKDFSEPRARLGIWRGSPVRSRAGNGSAVSLISPGGALHFSLKKVQMASAQRLGQAGNVSPSFTGITTPHVVQR